MNENILELEPKIVWKNFRELTLIPRPSKHEEKITDFLKKFGDKYADKSYFDKAGNVVYFKHATPGMENREPIVLQAHCDMVPQKDSNKKHDFLTDPITTLVKDGFVCADGTTLGADDGMGVAAIMSIFEDNTIEHPDIEALITIDEETGLTGANGVEENELHGKILLNLDSEEDNIFYIGCAGGVNIHINKKLDYEELNTNNYQKLKVKISGLNGGHSGGDIHKNRPNATKVLFRFLSGINFVKISTFCGGNMHNAIPREAEAEIFVQKSDLLQLNKAVEDFQKEIIDTECGKSDPEGKISVENLNCANIEKVLTQECFKNVKVMINTIISGVFAMSADMEGLVETSNNLSITEVKDGELQILSFLRSSVKTQSDYLKNIIKDLTEYLGATCKFSDEYPGWKANPDSKILSQAEKIYERLFNEKPIVKAIHAGLECGIITDKHPGMEAISLGPTMYSVHTPTERVEIKSVAKFYRLISEILKNSPFKINNK